VLEVVGLKKVYGSGPGATVAIGHLEFTVEEGELLSIVGPSGAGKTTLIKCMAGLLLPTEGTVSLRGRRITEPPPEMAVVFQDYSRSLFAWFTNQRNVELPLRHGGKRVADPGKAAARALAAVGLAGFEKHYPWQLSGGMQQRVAIARGLAYQPEVLVMDEPFASVDAQTRAELEDLVLEVRREFGITVILVTHDIDEAVYMSDRVVVLSRPPSTVQETVDVDLPRPRHQADTKALPEFARLRTRVYESIVGPDRRPASGGVRGS
jgi:NitT/TauT family transport system ATP-binding protein